MKNSMSVVVSLVGGVVITLLTGLLNSTPGGGLIGATWYGYPLAWTIWRAVGPQYNPWVVSYFNLIIDIVFWFVVVWIVIFAASRMLPATAKRATSKRSAGRRR